MRWKGGRRSGNVEDRRGVRLSRGVAGGGIGGIVLMLVALYFGIDPGVLMQGEQSYVEQPQAVDPGQEEMKAFVSVVLADTEDTWNAIFDAQRSEYREPTLVLFSGAVQSACGVAGSEVGPFYCPADQQVYLDLRFFDQLEQRFGAPGDFAQAYVIAHEVGHHVQTLLGISERVHGLRGRVGAAEANALSVRMELQADCFAGVWGFHANRSRQLLEQGDIEEGLRAASAIGDDRLQSQASGRVNPESFTHGSSEQRARWFRRGLESGDPAKCDSFGAESL